MLREWVIMLGLVPAKVHAYSVSRRDAKEKKKNK